MAPQPFPTWSWLQALKPGSHLAAPVMSSGCCSQCPASRFSWNPISLLLKTLHWLLTTLISEWQGLFIVTCLFLLLSCSLCFNQPTFFCTSNMLSLCLPWGLCTCCSCLECTSLTSYPSRLFLLSFSSVKPCHPLLMLHIYVVTCFIFFIALNVVWKHLFGKKSIHLHNSCTRTYVC